MRLVSAIRLEQDGLAGLVEGVLWKRLGRKKISMEIWRVVVLEVDRVWLLFTFGVFILKKKVMYGRRLHVDCFGRKEEEEGELFPDSSRGCLSRCLCQDSDSHRTRGK